MSRISLHEERIIPTPALWRMLLTLLLAPLLALGVVDPFKYTAASHLKAGGSPGDLPALFLHALSPFSLLLLLLLVTGALHLLWREARHGDLSLALSEAPSRTRLLLLACLLFWLGHTYLTPGWLVVGDANAHLARILHLTRAWREGAVTWWSNEFYAGTPVLQFTGPLFFWITAALAAVIDQADGAVKLVLLACHFFSAWAMHGLTRAWGMGRWGAAIAALIYAGSFAHLHLLLHGGMFPQALVFAALPALFWTLWRVARTPPPLLPAWGLFCLSAAFLLLTHQSAALAAAFLALLFTVATWLTGLAPWQRVGWLAGAGVVAVLMASAFLFPILLESSWVVMGHTPAQLHLVWPATPRLATLFTWRGALAGSDHEAYVGLVAAALVPFALFSPARHRFLVALLSLLLLLALCLRISYVRNVVFILFFLAPLAGFGAERLATSWPRAGKRVVLLLLLLDLTSTAIQPWARTDKTYFDTAAQRLLADFKNQRVLLLADRRQDSSRAVAGNYQGLEVETGPNGGLLARHPLQKLDGPHNLSVPKTHNYLVALLKRVEREVNAAGRLTAGSRNLLCLLNVGLLARVDAEGQGLTGRLADSVPHADLGGILPLPCRTPVVAAPRLFALTPPPPLDSPPLWREHPVSDAMERLLDQVSESVDLARAAHGVVAALPVRNPPTTASASPPLDRLELLDYQVTSDRVALTVASNGSGYAHLAHPWYPALVVTRNGIRITPLQGALGFMVVPVIPGRNTLVIQPTLTPMRQTLAWVGLATFAIVLGITLFAAPGVGIPSARALRGQPPRQVGRHMDG